jgi:drug/metabolite transporter (DMT)-like permease
MYIGFSQASTTVVSTLGAMYFVVAAILGMVFLGDDVTMMRFTGIAFACLSIVLITR